MSTVHPFTDAPVMFLIGYGFRPAYMPADYIGPRMDCPMWLPAPDADVAYLGGKYDSPAPLGHGFGFVLWPKAPATDAPQITAASLAGPTPAPAVWHPSTPSQPWWPSEPNGPDYPCQCITELPSNPPLPEPSPVPVEAGSFLLLISALAFVAIVKRRRSC